MRAFEIHLNGKKLCVAGLEEGMLLFSVSGTQNKIGNGEVGLSMTGVLFPYSTVRWLNRSLRMNDEVRIRIVETPNADKFTFMQKVRDSTRYEKAYVRRMAKRWGWTIQTGAKEKNLKDSTTLD